MNRYADFVIDTSDRMWTWIAKVFKAIFIAYADARYFGGTWVGRFMWTHNMTSGLWKPLLKWASRSESVYNCLIDPALGKRVHEEQVLNRYGWFFDDPRRGPIRRGLAKWVSRNLFFIERRYRMRWIRQQIEIMSRKEKGLTKEQRQARKRIIANYRLTLDTWQTVVKERRRRV